MGCPICKSESRLEAESAYASRELSQNEICSRFGLDRKAFGLHLRECLSISKSESKVTRRLADVKRKKHSGHLEAALESARRGEAAAVLRGDQVSQWRFAKEVSKLLALQSRQVGTPKPELSITSKTNGHQGGPVRILPPEKSDFERVGLGDLWERFFSPAAMKGRGDRQRDIPQDAATVRFSIEWRQGEIENADAEKAEEAEAAKESK